MAFSAKLMTVLRELSLQQEMLQPPAESRRRFIVRDGRLRALPSSPLGIITTSALSVSGKLRALAEPWVPRSTLPSEAETVAQLVRRRFGHEVMDYIVDPFVSGVYAGDPEKLSSRFALRVLSEFEKTHGSVVRGFVHQARKRRGSHRKQETGQHSGGRTTNQAGDMAVTPPPHILTFTNGLQQLPRAIAGALTSRVQYNTRVTEVAYRESHWHVTSRAPQGTRTLVSDALIVTVPAHQLRLVGWPDRLERELRAVRSVAHAPVATVALGFRRAQVAHPLNGFGVLVPHREQRQILGALFNSSMFAGRAPEDHVLLTCFVGGARYPGLLTRVGAEAAALRELAQLLGISGDPVMASTRLWSDGIPQCNLGTEDVIASLAKIETAWPGLHVAGSYSSGVAVADCLSNGLDVGARAAASAGRGNENAYRILAQAGSHSL